MLLKPSLAFHCVWLQVSPFEVLDSDTGAWARAPAAIAPDGATVLLAAPPSVVGVRYAWEGYRPHTWCTATPCTSPSVHC